MCEKVTFKNLASTPPGPATTYLFLVSRSCDMAWAMFILAAALMSDMPRIRSSGAVVVPLMNKVKNTSDAV